MSTFKNKGILFFISTPVPPFKGGGNENEWVGASPLRPTLLMRKGSTLIILIFSLMALLGLASFALDLGLILNQRYEFQKAVESAALIAASEYEPYENGANYTIPTVAEIQASAQSHYVSLRDTNQLITGKNSTLSFDIRQTSRTVMLSTEVKVPTYFISILGITNVAIQARAAAVNTPVYLSNKYPIPTGSVIRGENTGAPEYKDTDIKQPTGSVASNTITVNNQSADYRNIFGPPDGQVVSLGPGGYITIKLPDTLVDGRGVDFAIYERGHAEGYFVYAGIDTDTTDPYIDASKPGGGITWINVSCTGIPLYVNKNELIGCHRTTVRINGTNYTDYKFYGSGLFDLGSKCTNNGTDIYNGTTGLKISNVKYLKIIDDNREDGFFLQPTLGIATPSAIPTLIPGEHSTFTPGADIDAVAIFHHSRLISTSEITADNDSDGLINMLENILGLNPNSANTDSDTGMIAPPAVPPAKNDETEYNGTYGNPFLYKDCPDFSEPVPVFQVVPQPY